MHLFYDLVVVIDLLRNLNDLFFRVSCFQKASEIKMSKLTFFKFYSFLFRVSFGFYDFSFKMFQ